MITYFRLPTAVLLLTGIAKMPVEMVRAALAGRPLARNSNANWMFYGDVTPAAR